ncbi:YebC/PmpR family DNA-binding transcriptional regulator [Candidatus Oleimmundimicrobium sp.]|uniref:YebC/PmpR family DNA-binding transcriptional regulator n=1 Tax=Candidatus Oleimmundimicrobium sp. TaxID=3060597 RepID=UPI00271FF455|nr:YebC/PmpR family DNA-binding transcriptional regulator [Candidatus Oleimmundimicrobium sp.]MDO8886705.1 YebC/PmpR family DNA-binding transcriptional regulator [Candidatus Oleimmundimicrobium sp.]
MSGHSKWHSIKHKKSKEDVKKGKIFSKLSRYITVAAREGGGDISGNSSLALALQKAKDYNMPAANIERAIKKGTGDLGGAEAFEKIIYEGYGPAGVAVMVEAMTDNRNRTASDIRNIFSKHNGNLGTTGCVAWMFDRKGVILAGKDENIDEDTLLSIALEAGAEDLKNEDDHFEIITEPVDLNSVCDVLKDKGVKFSSATITMLPKDMVKLNKADAKKALKLMDVLEDHDDVQEVYSNFDIPDEVMDEIAAES